LKAESILGTKWKICKRKCKKIPPAYLWYCLVTLMQVTGKRETSLQNLNLGEKNK
jgi:hypothetical protein